MISFIIGKILIFYNKKEEVKMLVCGTSMHEFDAHTTPIIEYKIGK